MLKSFRWVNYTILAAFTVRTIIHNANQLQVLSLYSACHTAVVLLILFAWEFSTRLQKALYFLNLGWGRGMFHLYLCMLAGLQANWSDKNWISGQVALYVTFGVGFAFFILSFVHSRDEERFVYDAVFRGRAKRGYRSGPVPHILQLINASVMVLFATIFAYDTKYSGLCLPAECAAYSDSEFDYLLFFFVPATIVMSLFVLACAVITLAVEFSYGEDPVRRMFYFLNFSAGKAASLTFIGSIFFVQASKLGIAFGTWFMIGAVYFGMQACTQGAEEARRFERLLTFELKSEESEGGEEYKGLAMFLKVLSLINAVLVTLYAVFQFVVIGYAH